MSLLFDKHRLNRQPRAGACAACEADEFDSRQNANSVLTIGLINNMPDSALQATERQFMRLLRAAAGNARIHFHCFSLPSVNRSELARSRIDRQYTDIADLGRLQIDGLIVTGAEPNAATLPEEPFWRDLAEPRRLGEDQHALDDLVVPCRPCRGVASRWHRAATAQCQMFGCLRLHQGDRRLADAGMSPRRSRSRIRASTSCGRAIWLPGAISC